MRVLLISTLLVALIGCVNTGAYQKSLDKIGSGGKLLIFPLSDDYFDIKTTGTTIFNNTTAKHDISHWKVRAYISNAIAETLGNKFNTTSNQELNDRFNLEARDEAERSKINTLFKNQYFRNYLSEEKIDYVLIPQEISLGDGFYNTNQQTNGVGVFIREFMGSTQATYHTIIFVSLYDARTGSFIWSGSKGGRSSYVSYKAIDNNIADLKNGSKEEIEKFKHDTLRDIQSLIIIQLDNIFLEEI